MPAGRKVQPALLAKVTPELLPVLVMVMVPVVVVVVPCVEICTCSTTVPPVTLPVGLVIGVKLVTLVALHLPVATTYVVLVAGLLVPVPLPPLPVRLGTADVDPDGEWKRVKEPLPDS